MAVREGVLDEQVVRIFRVDVDRADRALFGNERLRTLNTVVGERLGDALVRMRRDLVDHGERVGVLLDEGEILVLGDKAVLHPGLGHVAHGALETNAVIRAVVERHERERSETCADAREAQGRELAEERMAGVRAALHVGLVVGQEVVRIVLDGVALLGDGKGDHLEGGSGEDFREAGAVLAELEALGDGSDDLLVDGAVGIQGHGQRQMVAGAVAAVDQLLIVAVAADDAGIGQACGEQALRQNRRKSAEQVACTEMQPGRGLVRSLAHGVNVVLRQAVTLPGRVMFDTLFCQFHKSGHILSVNGAASGKASFSGEKAVSRAVRLLSYIVYQKNGRLHRTISSKSQNKRKIAQKKAAAVNTVTVARQRA